MTGDLERLGQEAKDDWRKATHFPTYPGLRSVWTSAKQLALFGSERWHADQVRGLHEASEHPWQPNRWEDHGDFLLLSRTPPDHTQLAPAWDALSSQTTTTTRQSRRTLLESWIHPKLRVGKALKRLDLPQKHIDRYLNTEVTIVDARGPIIGGIDSRWFSQDGAHMAAYRWDRAVQEGPLVLDYAGFILHEAAEMRAAKSHWYNNFGDNEVSRESLKLGQLGVLLREWVHGECEGLASDIQHWWTAHASPAREEETVRVWVQLPETIAQNYWETPGSRVPAHRARWLLRNLDGLDVAGATIRVKTEPPLRPGRAGANYNSKGEKRRLFSRWHDGVQSDPEGLYSLTPEALALRMAAHAKGTVIDGTCGLGGMAIAFARQSQVERVIAIDNHNERLNMARHNARLYEVADKMQWHCCALRDVLPTLSGDLLAIDPPWGGQNYNRTHMKLSALNMNLQSVIDQWDGPLLLKLPRSIEVTELTQQGFRIQLGVDNRGIIKFLIATRNFTY